MITLAFYKGKTRPLDRAIQWWTASPYSHVELAIDVECGADGTEIAFTGLSSSPRDGGVREKRISVTPGHWDFVTVPGDEDRGAAFIRSHLGAPYDWLAIWGWHVLGCQHLTLPGAWLCSEIVPTSIGKPHWGHLHPGAIAEVIAP